MGRRENQEDGLVNILKRTGIKYFGNYILHGGAPGKYTIQYDETQDEMEDREHMTK